MKSLKISDYYKIVNPDYKYIKIIPSSAIKDYNSEGLSILANKIYKKLFERISFSEKQMFREVKSSIKYLICIKNNSVNFYYIVPQVHVSMALEVISKCWNNKATATVVDESEIRVLENPTTYEIRTKYEDFMAINTDSKSNKFLAKTLTVIDIMEEGDEVQIALNLIPMNRNNISWCSYFDDMNAKYESGAPVFKDKKSLGHILGLLRFFVFDFISGVLNELQDFCSDKKDVKNVENNYSYRKLSAPSTNKRDAGERLVDTQIVVMSKSDSKTREDINAKAVCNGFNEVKGSQGGNEFIYKKTKAVINIKSRVWPVGVNIMDARENANFISIPGQSILDDIKSIEHINTREVPPMQELLEGIVPYGNMVHKAKEYTMYLNENDEFAFLPIIIMTRQGGGKTSWFENVGVFLMNNYRRKMKEAKPVKKESLFVIDYIKNCEMSYNIMNNIDPEDIVKIDLSNPNEIQGIGFNEMVVNLNDKVERLDNASDQSQEMMKFIDTINEKGEPLSPKMRRYFNAACRVCFIHSNQALRNVIHILEYADVRHDYIERIPEELVSDLKSCIKKLEELDDGEGGTKLNLIQGILDRVGLIEENSILERMYNKDTTDNIDIGKCIQEGKAVFILMPQNKFRSPMVKNILVTYFISKLFIASIVRAQDFNAKQLTRCTMIIDEIVQAKGCYSTFDDILTQLRKFRIRPILSAHFWGQIKYFKSSLDTAGLSVILPQGSDKSNFEELKKEFNNNGFDIDDLLNLKKFNSLNAVQTEKGFTGFISQFPKPVDGKIEDRTDITFEEFKEGINARIDAINPKVVCEVEVENVIKVDFTKPKKEVDEVKVEDIKEDRAELVEDDFEIIEDECVILDDVINFDFDCKQLLLPAPIDDDIE